MKLHQTNRVNSESIGDVVGSQAATRPAAGPPWDFSSPGQDEILALLKPGDDRKRSIILVASALVVGLGLGWACAANIPAFHSITQTDMPSRRFPEIKSSGKSDGARRMASTSSLQTAPAPSTVSPAGAPFAKAEVVTAREPMTPVAETRPTTIEGWTVLEVRGGTAVLEGPDGVRTVVRGDSVPGIGRIDSIVRWGNRWIVAAANGLIATP
ncbi:hypothetical protein [uncultured Bradyrhizobium sp.]|uniref:hypothetical protein n=1 Tax=uncultured Bradyrhizobium sp. TaxID=199684 RepID=UPI0035C99D67